MISFCFPWTELLKESQSSCSGASSRQRDWDHKMASSRLKCVLLALTTLTQTKCDEYSRYSLITLSLAEFVLRGFWCHFVIQTEYEKQRHSNWFHLLLLFVSLCVCLYVCKYTFMFQECVIVDDPSSLRMKSCLCPPFTASSLSE